MLAQALKLIRRIRARKRGGRRPPEVLDFDYQLIHLPNGQTVKARRVIGYQDGTLIYEDMEGNVKCINLKSH